MLGVLNKKVSTPVGIIVLLLVASFVGWMILNEYRKVVETRYEMIEISAFEK